MALTKVRLEAEMVKYSWRRVVKDAILDVGLAYDNLVSNTMLVYSAQLSASLCLLIPSLFHDLCTIWGIPLTQLGLNIFGQIVTFSIVCKMENVELFTKVFLHFYSLKFRTNGAMFHVTPINVGGNKSVSFLIPAKSFHDLKRYFFMVLHDPAW